MRIIYCSVVPSLFSYGVVLGIVSMPQLLSLLQSTRGQVRRLAWRAFGALARALWTSRNKLSIEGVIPSHSANYILNGLCFSAAETFREEEGL